MNRSTTVRRRSAGFTVLEMTVALAMAMGIAGALIGLLQQQVSFMQALNDFSFLRDDAPQTNTLLTNIINKSDNYRIYPDLATAKNQGTPIRSGGKSLRLRFRHPDGTADHAIVSFEFQDGANRLNYYFRDKYDNSWPSSPTWTISNKPADVTFDNTTGILLVTLTGDEGEEITYAGNPD